MSQWARSVYPHSFPATATVKMTMITMTKMTKMTKMTMTTMKIVFADDNDEDTDDQALTGSRESRDPGIFS